MKGQTETNFPRNLGSDFGQYTGERPEMNHQAAKNADTMRSTFSSPFRSVLSQAQLPREKKGTSMNPTEIFSQQSEEETKKDMKTSMKDTSLPKCPVLPAIHVACLRLALVTLTVFAISTQSRTQAASL